MKSRSIVLMLKMLSFASCSEVALLSYHKMHLFSEVRSGKTSIALVSTWMKQFGRL